MRLLLVLILAGLMHAARSFAPDATVGGGAAGTALACGYLLLSAFLMGSIIQIASPAAADWLSGNRNRRGTERARPCQPADGVQSANLQWRSDRIDRTHRRRRTRSPRHEALMRSITWLTVVAVCGTACLIARCVALHSTVAVPARIDDNPGNRCRAVLGVTMVANRRRWWWHYSRRWPPMGR